MNRPFKDYQIVSEWPVYMPEYGQEIHMIQGLYDQDRKEKFRPSELPIWNGRNLPGYITPTCVSDPYKVDCGSAGIRYFIDVSILTVFPNGMPSYDINLPREGWLVCEYQFAKSCDWH